MAAILYFRHLRLGRGFTQSELAELCGVDQGSLSLYEAGKRTPRAATRARLEQALGADWDRLQSPAQIITPTETRRIPK